MAIALNQGNLERISKTAAIPGYDRSAITPGILHIGVGNFHRAHQAIYLDRLFNNGLAQDWGLVGAGVRPQDSTMREELARQDWLSTVVELDPEGDTARVCGAMIDYVDVDPGAVVAALARPEIRIVSLTITEGGYFIDESSGGFDNTHPDIVHDSRNPDTPRTVFGMLIAGLVRRRENGIPPFTIMSCDNLPENGHITRQAVAGMAEMVSAELAEWVVGNVAFPNSMVDCITPATGERERTLVRDTFGIDDAAPVACEPFRQWVLEDNFPLGRPPLENAGVEFVDNVADFELMKLRILNGGHAIIAYPSALLGIEYVADATADPRIAAFLEKVETEEIVPTLNPDANLDYAAYLKQVARRFSNSRVGDTIPRLCFDGSNRQPKFIFPVITERLEAGLPINGLALEVAFWCRYCFGSAEEGSHHKIDDEAAERLQRHAILAKNEPAAFLAMEEIFGPLSQDDRFVAAFSSALLSIWESGTAAALDAYLRGETTGDHLLRRSAH